MKDGVPEWMRVWTMESEGLNSNSGFDAYRDLAQFT